MKVVITGGCGFIGSNLTHELVEEDEVMVIDDLSTGRLENNDDLLDNENYRYVKGSITDLNLLKQFFDGVDYIFHQAAIPSVPRSIKDPAKTNEVNISGSLKVLIAAEQNRVKKVVYASSSSVYGDTPILPKEEEMIIKASGTWTNPILTYMEPRDGDVKHSLADIRRAESIIGYKPSYTLDDGLKETIKWFSNEF